MLRLIREKWVVGAVAWCRMGHLEGHLRGMTVLRSVQGTTVAWSLLADAEKEVRMAGCHYATPFTTVVQKRAMRFYEKQGCSQTGKVKNFFGMPVREYGKALKLEC